MRSISKGYIFLFLFLLSYYGGAAQCTLITMPDTVYACKNDTVSIQALYTPPIGYTILDSNWSPMTGVDTTNFYHPVFTTSSSQTYTLTIFSLTPTDYVADGNFDSLNTNNQYFTSSYIDTSGAGSLWPESHYSIQNNPFNVHPNFSSFGDHTTGTGNMMVVNGASTPVDIWCQTIVVTPNTYYDFSAWAASCTSQAPAVLQFKINGVLIDSPLNLTTSTGVWEEFHALWYSDTSTVITICINDQQTALTGNDFAIDDISFKLVCLSKDSVYVGVPDLNDSIGFAEQPCQNGLVTLSVINKDNVYSTTAQYTWSFGDRTTDTGAIKLHTYGKETYYLVSLNVSDYACADSFYNIIYVNNFTPQLPVSKDTAICAGGSAHLWVASGNSYQWSPTTGLDNATSQTPVATPSDTTTYYVTVNFGDNCVSQDTVIISVLPLPVVKASPDNGVVTCASPVLQLHVEGAKSYTWYPGNAVSDPLATDPFALPKETTTYVVTGTDSNKCVNKDSITVQVPDISKVFIPSAFTPNGDGKNDRLHPVSYCGFEIQEFAVFNRWGQRVFYSTVADSPGWDGTVNGTFAPMDTYFYELSGTTKDGIQEQLKGTSVLIR